MRSGCLRADPARAELACARGVAGHLQHPARGAGDELRPHQGRSPRAEVAGGQFSQVEFDAASFKGAPDVLIDYAPKEKSRRVAVVTCDIGSWTAWRQGGSGRAWRPGRCSARRRQPLHSERRAHRGHGWCEGPPRHRHARRITGGRPRERAGRRAKRRIIRRVCPGRVAPWRYISSFGSGMKPG